MALMFLLPTILGVAMQGGDSQFDAGSDPLLVRHPTVNQTSIVFRYADNLWKVARTGGDAIRLTNAPGVVSDPFFSPDGTQIAFSANYDGHENVYVMPAEGGVPLRLTAHPTPETVVGWTPDSKSVLFSSRMLSNTDQPRLFTVPTTGGFPTPVPLPSGTEASYSPDGTHLAYVPLFRWETAWKRYRGGQAYRIWVADLSDSHVKEIPRKNWNDNQPTWLGDKVYYLSDRTGPVGLYSYDSKTGAEKVEVPGSGFDLKSLTAGAGVLAYEKLGSIHIYDPATHSDQAVKINIKGDIADVRPAFKSVLANLDSMSISPSGSRLAVCGRGFVVTAPASKGDVHLTDETQGVHRRSVAWSPDGKTIAYITDVAGYRQVGLWDVATGTEKRMDIGDGPSLYDQPSWSPDSSKIAFLDYRQIVWILDVKTGKHTKAWYSPGAGFGQQAPAWSPDSKWLAFSDFLKSHFHVIKLYSLETGKLTQITDGLADAQSPVFDKGGKYLYFAASTHLGQAATLGDISQYNNPNPVSSLYAVLLKKGMPNPLQPESDEEGGAPAAPGAKPKAGEPSIDLDGIEDRIITLPAPAQVYAGLVPATPGSFYALVAPLRSGPDNIIPVLNAVKFSWATKSIGPGFAAITGLDVTPDGSKALVNRGPEAFIVSTQAPVPLESGAVNLEGAVVKVDPKKEWNHIFHEIWHEAPIHFYAPNFHGIDAQVMEKRYEPFLKNLASRDDLGHLIDDMMGELCIGHEFPGGGDIPGAKQINGGLLGADYEYANGHYKITRIYNGERWNPGLYAPLAQPGVDAKVGEYVLAIDGTPLSSSLDIFLALENKAGHQVKVKLGPNADGTGSREVTVQPVGNEFGLRVRAWEEDNRRTVLKETEGRAGYVHVPDTNIGGWVAFNRYYYAQSDRDGIVVDERFNHGGLFNDFMIHEMQKTLMAFFAPRWGDDEPTPANAIFGPKVLMINEFAGSGGDMFPWLFRHEKIGPLIGKRTWGGLVAVSEIPLADGGVYTSPDFAFYDHQTGKWDVENWGVAPDIDVELDPYLWRKGIDSQLMKAIEEINKRLANYHPATHKRPAYPDKTKLDVRY